MPVQPLVAAATQPVSHHVSAMPGDSARLAHLDTDQLRNVPIAVRLDHGSTPVLHVPDIQDGKIVSLPYEKMDPTRLDWVRESIGHAVMKFGGNSPVNANINFFTAGPVGNPGRILGADKNGRLILSSSIETYGGIHFEPRDAAISFTVESARSGDHPSFRVSRTKNEITTDMVGLPTFRIITNKHTSAAVALEKAHHILGTFVGGAFYAKLAGRLRAEEHRLSDGYYMATADWREGGWLLSLGISTAINDGRYILSAQHTGDAVAGLSHLFSPEDNGSGLFYGNFIVPRSPDPISLE